MINNKCPNCKETKIYEGGLFTGKMNERCSNCNLKYEKEPGFFFGAMYVSYALAIAEAMFVFVLGGFIIGEYFNVYILIPIALILLIMMPLNLRWSRLLWIHLLIKI